MGFLRTKFEENRHESLLLLAFEIPLLHQKHKDRPSRVYLSIAPDEKARFYQAFSPVARLKPHTKLSLTLKLSSLSVVFAVFARSVATKHPPIRHCELQQERGNLKKWEFLRPLPTTTYQQTPVCWYVVYVIKK